MSRFQAAPLETHCDGSWTCNSDAPPPNPVVVVPPMHGAWASAAGPFLSISIGLSSEESVDVQIDRMLCADVFGVVRTPVGQGVRLGRTRDLMTAVDYNRKRIETARQMPDVQAASRIICEGMGYPEMPFHLLDRLLSMSEDGHKLDVSVIDGEFGPEVDLGTRERKCRKDAIAALKRNSCGH